MLNNTTRFKQARHQTKVGSSIDKSTICEEFFRSCPEAVGVALLEVPHSVGALGRVRVIHVAGAAHQELDFVLVVRNDVFSYV